MISHMLLKHIGQFIFVASSYESYSLAIVTINGDQVKLPVFHVHIAQDTETKKWLSSMLVQMQFETNTFPCPSSSTPGEIFTVKH